MIVVSSNPAAGVFPSLTSLSLVSPPLLLHGARVPEEFCRLCLVHPCLSRRPAPCPAPETCRPHRMISPSSSAPRPALPGVARAVKSSSSSSLHESPPLPPQ